MSLERAQAVAAYLVSLGVRKESEITAVGYGAGQPIADNNTADGVADNRRVEITILEN
jgi:outer membrane protein OmpA-like peptidoglycan-associated protein